MSNSTQQDDLAYIRSIAEEGRNVPLVGSTSYILWGCIIGTTALLAFLSDAGVLPRIHTLWLWSGALVIGWAMSFVLGTRTSCKPGASTLANRTVAAAWIGCGGFVTLYWLSLLAAMALPGDSPFPVYYLFATMFPVAFGLYGLAFFVTAVVANQPWYRWVSFASWATALALILILSVRPDWQLLIAAIGTYGVVLWPGIVMHRNEPSETV